MFYNPEKILDKWADMVCGRWRITADGVELEAIGDTWEYPSIQEAAADAAYTIEQLQKEV